MRNEFMVISALAIALVSGLGSLWHWCWWLFVPLLPLVLVGTADMIQKKHTILRNFPVIGHLRYWFEMIRPEISQYFIESNTDGKPFSREQRSIVYQRAKLEMQTLPFGTQQNLYRERYQWIVHSLAPIHVEPASLRVMIGEGQCGRPYHASLLNVSAMSYGSLSPAAIRALSGGAQLGNFALNTGEGGVSPHHAEPGGDLIWQIGTGYFGCRAEDGGFDEAKFIATVARTPSIKMIELKLSQGAKPSHGGILPAKKLTAEICEIRGVSMGRDVISPPAHTAFSTPLGMMAFLSRLREVAGGIPIGFKLCVGRPDQFFALCKAMQVTGMRPDFITVDGAEGGTGAAPLEFSNSLGMPLNEGLVFVHNVLMGFGLREKIKIIASGKVISGFDIIHKLALGADLCNSARGMMFALGCIQALRCNTNACPTGVATQDPELFKGLHVPTKMERVANFHRETIKSVAELLGAIGLASPDQVEPSHMLERVGSHQIKSLAELYPFVEPGAFLSAEVPDRYDAWFLAASPDRFN